MADTQTAASTGGAPQSESLVNQAGAVFTNRNLFSGYYLGTLLAREVRARQGETGARMPLPARRRLLRLWEDVSARFGAATGYARTRQGWLEPLLTALGYEPLEEARAADFGEDALPSGFYLYRPPRADVQGAPPRMGTIPPDMWAPATAEAPDAAPDAEIADEDADADERVTADPMPLDDEAPADSGAVLLALLAWGDDFDHSFPAARRRSETPHKLMERLLAAGPAAWGMLVNGQRVRLLKRTVVSGRQQYLEVDLDALFDGGSDRDFDAFWTLFRARAFAPDATGRSLMEVVDEGSRTHAERVSATLKTSVFGAMERLMTALVARAQDIQRTLPAPDDDAAVQARYQAAVEALGDLKRLYEQSLILLYRLLFILYAESRELLPTANPVYRDSYSLEPLRDEVERPGVTYEPDGYRLWESAQALFRLIHFGCRTTELVVPAYNGELFRPASVALLNALRVPDDALAEVIRLLSLTPATKDRGRERISYRDLDVEQLGAVYEGLLEFEPRVASEPVVEVRYKDQTAVIPEREARDYTVLRRFDAGQFYLGRGAGRKTTGSYYTPQPLVEYLVRRTLEPLVEGRTADEILDLKVVDPAMGSGAFLVGACNYLAEAYGEARQRERRALQAAIGEIELDAADAAGAADAAAGDERQTLSEEAIRPYRRLVAERCIYGVDLNPMAVELAKVSLWLTTLAGDKPLTFLDAHLRCGNSLIGAPLHAWTDASGARQYSIDTIHPEANKRLQKGRGGASARTRARDDGRQPRLFSDEAIRATVEPLVGRMTWLASKPSDTVADVHAKELLFAREVEGDPRRTQLKAVCDLWVAAWFWRQPPPDAKPDDPRYPPALDGAVYRWLAEHLRGRAGLALPEATLARYLAEARRVANAVRPFHWELEFPEVYYEQDGARRERPGFDATLGNPPWDIVKPNSREFFSAYDPGFRELERQQAEARQERLLRGDGEIASAWDAHTADLTSQVDFYRLSDLYPWQSVEVDGRQTGGDANTYKLFLERAYGLLRAGGGGGIIVPSGLYTDQGCTGLRQLFLGQARITALLCFENRRKIFPIHRSFKFVLFSFRRQPPAGAVPAAFMLHDLDTLADPEPRSVRLPADLIRRLSPDTLSLMEFRSQADVDVVSRIYGRWPLLGEQVEGAWNVQLAREFHMTDDRPLFQEVEQGWPLYEGKTIHQYTNRWEPIHYWVEPVQGRSILARLQIQRIEQALDDYARGSSFSRQGASRTDRVNALLKQLGRGPLTESDMRIAPDAYRLAFRDVAANTNERAMIVCILPNQAFSVNTLNTVVPWRFDPSTAMESPHNLPASFQRTLTPKAMAYLCGVLNSFTLDYALRFKITTHVNQFYTYQLPVPRLMPGDARLEAIAARVGRLVCVGSEFDALRRELLGDVAAHVATEEDERQALKNEIDALVAHLYGLSEDDLAHILYAPYTFPLVKRAVKDGVMAAYRRLGG